MSFGTITSTENTFGSIDGTTSGVIPGTLTGSVGVPGPQGPAGPAGPQGPAGEGVPAGGSAGQVLAKIDGTDYNTEWVNVEGDYLPLAGGSMDVNAEITLSDGSVNSEVGGWGFGVQETATPANYATVEPVGVTVTTGEYASIVQASVIRVERIEGNEGISLGYSGIQFNDSSVQTTAYPGGVENKRDLTDYNFTNVADTKLATFGMTIQPPTSEDPSIYNSFLDADELKLEVNTSEGGTVPGYLYRSTVTPSGMGVLGQTWTDQDGEIVTSGPISTSISSNGITFPGGSFQNVAFPGFNNVALTGNPTAPTPPTADNDTSIATTAFVKAQGYATLASPTFTGDPKAPTAALGDNDTSIATTAFVQQELLSGTANARNLEVYVRNQTGSTIPAGSIVYINGATGNRPTVTLAQANNDANSAQTIGFTKTSIANNGFGFVIVRGELENINTSALSEGVQLYLSPTTAGTWTTTKPSAPDHLVYVGIVIRSHPTLGVILVSVQNGYELGEIHDVAITSEANNDLLVYELSTDLWKNKSFSTLGLATLNSPTFSGTPSLPTGTTAVTQSAGNNTTALATTAFVQQEVPAASTTAAGKVELATNAEAVAGTSTTTAMTPAANYWADKKSGHSFVQFNILSASTSGTGASAGASAGGHQVSAPTSAVGYGCGFASFPAAQRGLNRGNGSWNWAKAFTATFRYSRNAAASDSNSISRVTFGKNTFVGGDPTVCCVGIRMAGSNALQLIVHNGTTLTAVTTTSSIVPTVPFTTDIRITSDGAGNVSLYVNDVLEATTSAGPTGTSGTSASSYIVNEAQNAAIITGTAAGSSIYNLHFEFAD